MVSFLNRQHFSEHILQTMANYHRTSSNMATVTLLLAVFATHLSQLSIAGESRFPFNTRLQRHSEIPGAHGQLGPIMEKIKEAIFGEMELHRNFNQTKWIETMEAVHLEGMQKRNPNIELPESKLSIIAYAHTSVTCVQYILLERWLNGEDKKLSNFTFPREKDIN